MKSESPLVMIVDDMMINRMIISSLLASDGIMSHQAESGIECLEMCKENDYDLILLDHRMPEFDGVDTFLALKELFKEKGKDVPVICHTIEEGRRNINLYKAAGFAEVLIKPIDPKELSEMLVTYLGKNDSSSSDDEEESDVKAKSEAEIKEGASGDNTELDVSKELDKLPVWLKTVPHLDLSKGISNCGGAEDYIDALYIFTSSIQEKTEEIKNYLREDEWSMYKLSVHSLKSIARLVGARDLSNLAKEMEEASKDDDYSVIRKTTPELLSAYSEFEKILPLLVNDEDIRQIIEEVNDEEEIEEENYDSLYDTSKSILYIRQNQGVVTKGIEKNLKDAGYKVIPIQDEPDIIISSRRDADIILYHPIADNESHISITMNLIGEICRDDSKMFFLIGDVSDLEIAMESEGASSVIKKYERPVDMQHFIEEMGGYSKLLEEYKRQKCVFVVDDDPDYLSVITRWLSKFYQVSSFNSGEELIDGLSAATPDLILMDYEMPNMDGYDLMKIIRSNQDYNDIPVIFLTGKNDRDHVFKILNYKPDGYLLKTSQKENLLDAIDRFFIETMYKRARQIESYLKEIEEED